MKYKLLSNIFVLLLLISSVAGLNYEQLGEERSTYWQKAINVSINLYSSNDCELLFTQQKLNEDVFLCADETTQTLTVFQSSVYLTNTQISSLEDYANLILFQNENDELLSDLIDSVAETIVQTLDISIQQEVPTNTNNELIINSNSTSIWIYIYLISALILIAIAPVLIIYNEIQRKREKHIHNEIKQFISTMLSQGHSLVNIKLHLVKQGYDQKVVESIAKNIK